MRLQCVVHVGQVRTNIVCQAPVVVEERQGLALPLKLRGHCAGVAFAATAVVCLHLGHGVLHAHLLIRTTDLARVSLYETRNLKRDHHLRALFAKAVCKHKASVQVGFLFHGVDDVAVVVWRAALSIGRDILQTDFCARRDKTSR